MGGETPSATLTLGASQEWVAQIIGLLPDEPGPGVERNFKLVGEVLVTRDFRVTEQQSSFAERVIRTQGTATTSQANDFRVRGQVITSDTRDFRINGQVFYPDPAPILDTFNRPDEDPLAGGSWAAFGGLANFWQVISNQAFIESGTLRGLYWNAAVPNNQEASIQAPIQASSQW